MATVLGARALMDLAVPQGIDANELMRFEMEEGMTPQEVIALAATTIGEANEYVSQRMGGLFVLTERISARYRQGGVSGATPLASEFSMPDGRRTEAVGHMLPRHDYTDATEWSRMYLERAYREDIRDDLEIIKERWINRVIIDVLYRAFTKAENPIGQAGWDVGWVVGDPGQNVPYIPPQRGARVFDSTINHYHFIDGVMDPTNALAAIQELAKMLSWVGHTGRKSLLVSESDLAVYTAMDSSVFVRVIPSGVNIIGGSNTILTSRGELEGVPGEIFGMVLTDYGTVELRYHERIPSGRMWMSKPYGVNDRRNGLALRVERGRGFGMVVDPQVSRSINPSLEKVLFMATHGVGVSDRTNGAVAQIGSGLTEYVDPVPTDFGSINPS